jgi:hypothetical protein
MIRFGACHSAAKQMLEADAGRWRHHRGAGGRLESGALRARQRCRVLSDLSAGRVPQAWTPLETTTTEESSSSRRSIRSAHAGGPKFYSASITCGRYTSPSTSASSVTTRCRFLWGDRLVARFDSKLDRTTNTFVILGLWLEDPVLGKDEAFAEALARGFARFVAFLGASKLDAKAIPSRCCAENLFSRCFAVHNLN